MEAILGADDFSAERRTFGWINLPCRRRLDAFVARLARRIPSFPADAVRSAQRVLNELTARRVIATAPTPRRSTADASDLAAKPAPMPPAPSHRARHRNLLPARRLRPRRTALALYPHSPPAYQTPARRVFAVTGCYGMVAATGGSVAILADLWRR